MKLLTLSSLGVLLIVASLRAAPITGTVRLVAGDIATVAIDGDAMPPNGARGEFFFKMAGTEDEISVATGRALGIDHGNLLVKIEKATGTVEKDHRVRFAAAGPEKIAPGKNSIVGEWLMTKGGRNLTWIFKADGTTSWSEGSQKVTGKYRLDETKTPHQIDITNIDVAGGGESGLYGIFELQPDGTMKLNMAETPSTRPGAFDQHTSLFSRSPGPAASAPSPSSPAPGATAASAANTASFIVGNWGGTYGNGDQYLFTFRPDQTMTWTIIPKSKSSSEPASVTLRAKYRVDTTAEPNRLDMFDFESNTVVPKGETMHALFQSQGDSQAKMDLSQGAHEHPETGFGNAAIIVTRVP